MTLKDFARYAGNRAPELLSGLFLADGLVAFHESKYAVAAGFGCASLLWLAVGYDGRFESQSKTVRKDEVYRKAAVNKPME